MAGYGLAPGENPATEVASRVAGSLLRDRLVATLDLWLAFEPSQPVQDTLRDILRAADPDPYRDEVRGARAAWDLRRLAELTRRPEALPQSPGFAAALGQYRAGIPAERRREVLKAARRDRPTSLPPLLALGDSCSMRRESADERLRWYQAAVAAHPRNAVAHLNLGVALEAKGDAEGAIAEHKEAIRRNTKAAWSRNGLARLLAVGPDRVRDGKQAVEHAVRACELTGWKKPDYLDTLAAAYAEAGDFARAVEYHKKALSFPAFEKADGAKARQRFDLYSRKQPCRDPALAARPTLEPAASPRPTK